MIFRYADSSAQVEQKYSNQSEIFNNRIDSTAVKKSNPQIQSIPFKLRILQNYLDAAYSLQKKKTHFIKKQNYQKIKIIKIGDEELIIQKIFFPFLSYSINYDIFFFDKNKLKTNKQKNKQLNKFQAILTTKAKNKLIDQKI
ncbi:hypothetical protein TTHERM_000079488 (macronuclear) [Tetrahymena thermophila SB210]|uniref:Uncharacterized protein n=1 Tax=Tetrahymena thermophila (strain SB210) TaxID=312017 RepID=W7X524_TETTS|nr:hypothetical protein TTHERM_000079488 [Tetrahymena thermophila SB210]EWS74460.1 hypothetical protein TTHERM_000079488 [Tetrahymena thermophila SB210]|eukprot:XP_012653037.1 hypothetical protein TTHERM_000079488 [Tetrahymena thermophila SB210]